MIVAPFARAQFTPVPINPASFNHDVVVEASAPAILNGAVNATVDGGTNKSGNTFYEQGYNPAAPTTGVPVHGTTVSYFGTNTFQMAPDYHVNNVLLVGHAAGGRTPLTGGTLTLTTPQAYSGLSVLATSGNGPVTVFYTIHYADSTSAQGTFTALDWFNNTNYVFNAAGRVSMGGGVANVNGNPAGACYAVNVASVNTTVNITSIDFSYYNSGNPLNPYQNGRAVIFALSGTTDGINYSPVPVTGYNADVVVEADAPPTTGMSQAGGSILTNNCTATMDGGTSKGNNCWFEQGYYPGFPNSGFPAPGSTVASATLPATYTMPASYAANNAVLLASNVSSANITLATPASYGALSFLCATANGDTFIPCVLQFQDGSSETNAIFVPDWFNRVLPWSYLAFGRVNPNNRTLNNTPDQFVNPFIPSLSTPFSIDFRGLGLPVCRLFDAVVNVTNNTATITNIALSFTNSLGGNSTRVAAIFALSGAPVANVPPVFGYRGTPIPGQPANAVVNDITRVKAWEGTNNIVLSVTNIAGTSPISYQWKKAARGGGLHDIFYSIDYGTFANVTDGGRISGSQTSALVFSNAMAADSADYLVVASSPGGSVTSLVATVMILTTNQCVLVGVPAGDVINRYTSDITTAGEGTEHVIDQVAQKWLSSGVQQAVIQDGAAGWPFTGPVGYVVTPASGASVVTGMRFFVANDSSGRDPYDYTLEGSNDGSTWTRLTGGSLKGTLALPTGRNGTGSTALDALNQNVTDVNFPNATGYKNFRVSITNNYNPLGNGLMQIGEIQLLGTLVPNPPVWVRQPDSAVTVFVGGSPNFTVQASGYPPPRFQWYKNGSQITGATGSSFTFTNAQLSDSGSTFYVTAANTFGTIQSSTCTLTVIPAPTEAYPVAVLADKAIGYWRLNEGPDNAAGNNGVVTHDYMGGHDGYYSNAVIAVQGYNPNADPDTAANFGIFAAANSYVAEIRDVSFARATNASSGGTFSVEAWVNGANQTMPAAIVTKGYNGNLLAGTGTGTEQFVLDVTGNPSAFRFLVRDAAGNGNVAQSSVLPYDPNTLNPLWHHLVGVCDQPNGKVYLYVDGLLAASGTIGPNVGILTQPLPMTIGSRQGTDISDFTNQWTGTIDDVALYGTALSSTQVLSHFFAAQRPPIITVQPTNITIADNVQVTFNSGAYGSGTLTYQWYNSDGINPTTPVAGQTSSNMVFTTTPAQNLNYYQVVVANPYGSVTSVVAQLTVVSGVPQFIVDLPTSQTFFIGHIIQLQVTPGGTAPFTYQWQKNGVNITDDYRTYGSHTNTLTIFYANTGDSGNYQVIVANGSGSTPSAMDAVSVTAAVYGPPFNAAGTGWTMQGTTAPIMGNNRLELTSGLGSTARSAFMNQRWGISRFNASFTYTLTSGAGGADGITFCLQNDSRGATAVGGAGGSLGYSGITPSVALAFNIYDPNTRGIRLLENGGLPAAGAGAYFSIAPVLIGGSTDPIQVNLHYSGGAMTASFTDTVSSATFTYTTNVDIPTVVGDASAFVGFTGADGGVTSTQVITDFTMVPLAVPVTLQATPSGASLILSWPASGGAFLKGTPSLAAPITWSDVTAPVQMVGNQIQVTVTPLTGNQFYRLEVYP